MQLTRVDGIAQVVALAVGDVSYQVHILTFLAAKQTVNGIDQHLDDVDVLPLVETAYVVGVGNLAIVEYQVDGAGVVLYVQPVAHVLALAVDGQRFAVTYIVDEQRNQFFRELVWAVVVGTVGYNCGHAIGVVECPYEVVAACLRGRIRAVRVVLRFLGKELIAIHLMGRKVGVQPLGMSELQGAIYLVGRDVVEPLALVALGQRFPIFFSGL